MSGQHEAGGQGLGESGAGALLHEALKARHLPSPASNLLEGCINENRLTCGVVRAQVVPVQEALHFGHLCMGSGPGQPHGQLAPQARWCAAH